jgi:Arc/MetJ-type ribon-helix-helix transcriptional regulator
MTIQITVRLPDDQVHFIDELVNAGQAVSRADAVAIAVRREQRYRTALDDIQRLRETGDDQDLDALTKSVSRTPMPDLD